ncbi:hypothetical protein AURDEDRAFT_174867 [Auricularia subglabra TFB-10046 SS5]|nr:hypothetical protein AURDEDRAFT_174867 [Auricularia subglabra TFB-10046 SS5]
MLDFRSRVCGERTRAPATAGGTLSSSPRHPFILGRSLERFFHFSLLFVTFVHSSDTRIRRLYLTRSCSFRALYRSTGTPFISFNERLPSPALSERDVTDARDDEPKPRGLEQPDTGARNNRDAHIPPPDVLLGPYGHSRILRFLPHRLESAVCDWFDQRVFLPALSAIDAIPGLSSLALAVCYLTIAIGGQDLPHLPALPVLAFWAGAAFLLYCNYQIVTRPPPTPLELPAPAIYTRHVLNLLRALHAAQRVRDWWGRTVSLPLVEFLVCSKILIVLIAIGFVVFDLYVINNFLALPAVAHFFLIIAVAFQVALNNQLLRRAIVPVIVNFFPQ